VRDGSDNVWFTAVNAAVAVVALPTAWLLGSPTGPIGRPFLGLLISFGLGLVVIVASVESKRLDARPVRLVSRSASVIAVLAIVGSSYAVYVALYTVS